MEIKKAEDVLKLVITKAWEDELFKRELIADPVKTIETLTGAKVVMPEDKELVFIDQSDKQKVFVNIPSEPDVEDGELSQEQLESVAAGAKITDDILTNLYPNSTQYL